MQRDYVKHDIQISSKNIFNVEGVYIIIILIRSSFILSSNFNRYHIRLGREINDNIHNI